MPSERAGPLTYGLVFRNPTAGTLEGCQVRHRPPAGAVFVRATPEADFTDGEIVWELGSVPAGAAHRLGITVRVPVDWTPPDAADFLVTQRGRSVIRVPVVRPAVTLVTSAGPGVVGRPIGLEVVVENTGNGPLRGATLTVALPDGLTGPPPVALPVVPAGARRATRLEWPADRVGWFIARLAVSGGGLAQPATAEVHLRTEPAPLRLAWSPLPALVVGEPTDVNLIVEASDDISRAEMSLEVPPLLNASGTPSGVVVLTPGGRTNFSIQLTAQAPGPFRLVARAAAGEESGSAEVSVTATARPAGVLESLLASVEAGLPTAAIPTAPPLPSAPRHLVFRLGREDFGLPLMAVQEVLRPVEVAPVPHAPEWLPGVANVRGEIVSVSDLGAYLGVPDSTDGPSRRLLVVRSAGGEVTAGLLVDAVVGLRSFAAGELRAAPAAGGRLGGSLAGLADSAGRTVALLDPDRLLLSDEFRPDQSA